MGREVGHGGNRVSLEEAQRLKGRSGWGSSWGKKLNLDTLEIRRLSEKAAGLELEEKLFFGTLRKKLCPPGKTEAHLQKTHV